MCERVVRIKLLPLVTSEFFIPTPSLFSLDQRPSAFPLQCLVQQSPIFGSWGQLLLELISASSHKAGGTRSHCFACCHAAGIRLALKTSVGRNLLSRPQLRNAQPGHVLFWLFSSYIHSTLTQHWPALIIPTEGAFTRISNELLHTPSV